MKRTVIVNDAVKLWRKDGAIQSKSVRTELKKVIDEFAATGKRVKKSKCSLVSEVWLDKRLIYHSVDVKYLIP